MWKRFSRAKQNAPGLSWSRGASVDQPSPKCCSRTTLCLQPEIVNGSSVPSMARNGLTGAGSGRKTKRPDSFESWAPVDQPSPKCCSKTTLRLHPKIVNGPAVPCAPATQESAFSRKTKRPRLDLSLGTSVDQPSPKCCSRTTLRLPTPAVNGSLVLPMARTWGGSKVHEN